jgi:penicillin-binding protein 2
MSFHPNDIGRRSRVAALFLIAVFGFLLSAFFRAQVVEHGKWVAQAAEQRERQVPLPAPRGTIYDRTGKIIAENLPGYSVSVLTTSADSLRATLQRLSGTIQLSDQNIELAIRRYRRAPGRPAVILPDATFQEVSILEEHRVEFPSLIIQSAPKRYYPDGPAVAAFVGYTAEINEADLAQPRFAGYKAGQVIGKAGLERQYEEVLRGKEGYRAVEVDALGRVVREDNARPDRMPVPAEALHTNIDLDLQKFVVNYFGDSLQGGVVAMDPTTGAVLAIHSAPTYDPNRLTGVIPPDYWAQINTDPRRPMYNKAIQGRFPPASTFKLATSIIGLQRGAVKLTDHMPVPCTGGFRYGRYFKCWDHKGHGDITLAQAIEKSCDVYFYQLGLKLGLANMLAGGISLKFNERSGIDLPSESRPQWPESFAYFNKKYGERNWVPSTNALIMSIGQGDNAQSVVNMARFYTSLATDGRAAKPEIVTRRPERTRLFTLTPEQMSGVQAALAGVLSRGTGAGARIAGLEIAGKTGTAQNPPNPDHAWFVGYAPTKEPKIVVAVLLEYGLHGSAAARVATKIMEFYLKTSLAPPPVTEGE